MQDIEAGKLFSIGEVSEYLQVKEHTIRFWEKEFPFLKPDRTAQGRRTYHAHEIVLLFQIKRFLYDEGFTVKGVLKHFEQKGLQVLIDEGRALFEVSNPQSMKANLSQQNQSSLVSNPSVEKYFKEKPKMIPSTSSLEEVSDKVEKLIQLWEAWTPDE